MTSSAPLRSARPLVRVDLRRSASSPLRQFLRRIGRSRTAVVGGVIVALFLLAALLGPAIAPFDPLATALRERLLPPASPHWLGTDSLGRDILSRLLHGGSLSMLTGVVVGLVALAIGLPIGVVAGYAGGRADEMLMRTMDVLLAFPGILLAIGIVGALGPGLLNVMIAVGVVTVPSFARIARASTLRTKNLLFVDAARSIGAGRLRILGRHVLPNILSPVIVLFAMRVATAILTASSMGFLGLGAQPPLPEWGAMLSDGRVYLRTAPHVATIPGLAIMFLVLGFNLLGDGLRDALDPRMKEQGAR